MLAGAGHAAGLMAGVGKPPMDEPAGVVSRYGDLAKAVRLRGWRTGLGLSLPRRGEPSRLTPDALTEAARRGKRAAGTVSVTPRTGPAWFGPHRFVG